MSISAELRERVRQRAHFACEFCGVSETDTAGQLTIDHFQPRVQEGTDDIDNLSYCCHRCNEYKADYWPSNPTELMLWNPRRESFETHFLMLDDGLLYAKTRIGDFTLKRLRLNRTPLVRYRVRRHLQTEESRILERLGNALALLQQIHQQEAALLEEHQALLDEQRALLRFLLDR